MILDHSVFVKHCTGFCIAGVGDFLGQAKRMEFSVLIALRVYYNFLV